jgi:hypothetical protein
LSTFRKLKSSPSQSYNLNFASACAFENHDSLANYFSLIFFLKSFYGVKAVFRLRQAHIQPCKATSTHKQTMYQCSICTAGSVFCSLDQGKKCTACGTGVPHICSRCIAHASGVMPTTCYLCTSRKHDCLSKCSRGCILREKPKCKCRTGCELIRLQVQKQNKNHGRYFWTSRECGFFEWESK